LDFGGLGIEGGGEGLEFRRKITGCAIHVALLS